MNWTDERLTTALRDLDVPAPDDGFWTQLGAAMRATELAVVPRADPTEVDVHPLLEHRASTLRGRRPRHALLAVAASVAALVAGVVLLARSGADDPAANGPVHLAITNPHAITLDALPRAAPPPAPLPGGYFVLDHGSLPSGWAVADEEGLVMNAEPNGHYTYRATLTAAGNEHSLWVGNLPWPDDPRGEAVEINGHDGYLDQGSIVWRLDDSLSATIGPIDRDIAVGLASALAFIRVDAMPTKEILPTDVPPMSDPVLSGRLNGVHWSLFLTDLTTTGGWLYIGRDLGTGVERDTSPGAAPDVSATGVPGYGAVVWGSLPLRVRSVRVLLADGSDMTVPIARTDDAVYFAVPVPPGLAVDGFEFLSENGEPIARGDMPELPASFGGSTPIEWQPA